VGHGRGHGITAGDGVTNASRGYHAPPAAAPRLPAIDREEPIPNEPPTPGPEPGLAAWWRPLALALSCLVIGFVLGWAVFGGDEPGTLAPAAPGGAQAVDTSPRGTTVDAQDEPPGPPPRSEVQVAVLNGTDVDGLAARTAGEAEALGYADVIAGNAPTTAGPSTVYFRPGERPSAERLARDLDVAGVEPLPGDGGIAAAVPAGAAVALVLGAG